METAGLAVAVSLLTLLFREGVPAVVALLKARGEQSQADEADRRTARQQANAEERKQEAVAVKELKELVAVLRRDGQEYREQIHDLRDQLQEAQNKILICEMDRTRQAERIRALEDALERAGIPFHRSDDSGTYTPLPPKSTSGRFRRPSLPPPTSPGPSEDESGE